MRVCSICGERNEDWMEICQRCGNSIVNATMVEPKVAKKIEPVYENMNNNQYQTQTVKERKPIANIDLKIILIVLLVILICLILYTVSTIV